jgi:antitoxin YefM
MATEHDISNGMSISEARNKLTQLHAELTGNPGMIPLTRYGVPVMALVSWDLFESIQATMEIMADPELAGQLRESIKEINEGRTIALDDLKAELEL